MMTIIFFKKYLHLSLPYLKEVIIVIIILITLIIIINTMAIKIKDSITNFYYDDIEINENGNDNIDDRTFMAKSI